MKKLFCVMMAVCLVVLAVGCGASSEEKDRLEAIKERGYIDFVTEPYFAPYEFLDPTKEGDEQFAGMDIEIAKAIADKIGVELRMTALDFTAVQAGIADGKYDIAISAIAYSPVRAEAMNLSNVYLASETGYGFLVREEDAGKYNSIESVKDAIVITQSGSVQEYLCNDNISECKEFKLVANMTDGYLAVAEGRADVCVCSVDSAQLYADANGGLTTTEFRFDIDPNMNGVVAALPLEGTDSLMEIVNEVIAELNAAGKIDEWWEFYSEYAKTLGV